MLNLEVTEKFRTQNSVNIAKAWIWRKGVRSHKFIGPEEVDRRPYLKRNRRGPGRVKGRIAQEGQKRVMRGLQAIMRFKAVPMIYVMSSNRILEHPEIPRE